MPQAIMCNLYLILCLTELAISHIEVIKMNERSRCHTRFYISQKAKDIAQGQKESCYHDDIYCYEHQS